MSTGEAGKGGKKKEKGTTTARPKSQTPDVGIKCTVPKFYNVRPVAVMDESQPQPEIDEEVCVYMHILVNVTRYMCMCVTVVEDSELLRSCVLSLSLFNLVWDSGLVKYLLCIILL